MARSSTRKKRTSTAKSSPVTPTRSSKVLKSKEVMSDDERSEGGIAEMVVQSSGKWTAFGERSVQPEDEDEVAENGDDSADENDDDQGEDQDDAEDQDDDEDMDEDVFVVEKITGHTVNKDGTITFKVKWEGYEKKADQTWEPEDSLREGAEAVLDAYFEGLGGRDQIIEDTQTATKTKKRGRKSAGPETTTTTKRSRKNGHPADTTPPATAVRAGAWDPPAGSWEDHIDSIDVSRDDDTDKLIVFLNWKNGRKTKHATDVCYRRCPQKMLRFYENHIRFHSNNETAEGQNVLKMEDAVRDAEAQNEA